MSAWVVVDTKITNPEAYEEYKALAGPMIQKYGGSYRARGGETDVVEDDLWSPTRMVIVEFPDIEAARLFASPMTTHRSPPYATPTPTAPSS